MKTALILLALTFAGCASTPPSVDPVSPAAGQPWCSEVTQGQQGVTCKSADIQGHQIAGSNPTADQCPGQYYISIPAGDNPSHRFMITCWGNR